MYFEHRHGARSFGLDYSPVGCEVGAKNLELAGCTPRIVRGDIRALPLVRGSFDLVFSAGVVEHFEQYGRLIDALAGLVRPGGQLVTTVPNFAGWIGFARGRQDPETSSMHVRIKKADLRAVYQDAGLVDLDIGQFGSLRMPYQSLPRIRGLGSGLRGAAVATGRVLDKALVAGYRVSGRSIESEWLSSGLYAVGRRPPVSTSEETGPRSPS